MTIFAYTQISGISLHIYFFENTHTYIYMYTVSAFYYISNLWNIRVYSRIEIAHKLFGLSGI